ncbi:MULTISPECIES: hypothetical protein [unclassified Treponema]|uniref:hypothetical protein n=1 Tax=unclassified Treponema TaxID=2638727 RepID=UPI0020A5CBA4|nr:MULTISPECIES: hypothetical protein [unclassified Treponema]UTC67011.1 hypothetical protein E4O06_13890 [Treponema sp. OMZ 789]UTC69740.1 hypothetical protein E4O01_14030 [Treponema sp. OMZ 790]UTC72454.1 hypothetical protein E4O02_14120 [Treponema sp. OMZ 791]
MNLEQYYSGDDVWDNFVEIAKKEVASAGFNTDKSILDKLKRKLKDNDDIAYVAYYLFYNDSLNWIERRVSVLDNLMPIGCLSSEELTNRLREVLLRALL